jgi:hypothetical protein
MHARVQIVAAAVILHQYYLLRKKAVDTVGNIITLKNY